LSSLLRELLENRQPTALRMESVIPPPQIKLELGVRDLSS